MSFPRMFQQIQEEDKKNKLLPYAEFIDEEAFIQFQEIKTNLGLCITLREMRLPLSFWLSRLSWYIDLYKLKFPKEDHILLVKLLYDLATIPNLPLSLIPPVFVPLKKLLRKKKYLIPGEDLTLPWRPLFDLCKKTCGNGHSKFTVIKISGLLLCELRDLVQLTRFYFDPSATEEILDEFRPFLCPFDNAAMEYGARMLYFFLPLTNSPKFADMTYKVWFTEFMDSWEASGYKSAWDDYMMGLLAILAWLNVGDIDWEEHIPKLYVKFQRIFELPVYYKKTGRRLFFLNENDVTLWIIYTLGGGSVSQEYLDQLLKTLASYCQSANTGMWSLSIVTFLHKLTETFILRILREKFKEPLWGRYTPEHKKLNEEDIRRFVISLLSVSMSAIFSPYVHLLSSIFRSLASLRPDIVIPSLLDRLYGIIDCVTEPHKLTAVLKCSFGVARPMLTGGLNCAYNDGKKHIIPLLFAMLPGIDANDSQKTTICLQFINSLLITIPLVDCSSYSQLSELSTEDKEVANATSQFEDFVLQFLDRAFTIIESVIPESVQMDNDDKNDEEVYSEPWGSGLTRSLTSILDQCSPEIFEVALEKGYNYAMAKILDTKVAGVLIADMLKTFAMINADKTYGMFIPPLCSFILQSTKNQEVKNEERLEPELLYKMLLLSKIVGGSPSELKPYLPMLTNVLDETLHLKCERGNSISTTLLQNILLTFSNLYPLDVYGEASKEAKKTFLVREWGRGTMREELNIRWYCPGEEEISFVEQMFWKYLMPELEKIDKYNNDEQDYSREDIRCALKIIVSLFCGCNILLEPWTEEPLLTQSWSQVAYSPLNSYVGIERFVRMKDGSNIYKVLMNKMVKFQAKLLDKTDDTVAFMLLVKVWSYMMKYDLNPEMNYHEKNIVVRFRKKNYERKICGDKSNLRSVLINEVSVKHLQRIVCNQIRLTRTHELALVGLLNLATSEYKQVQAFARSTLHAVVSKFDDCSCLINGITENLKLDTTVHKERFVGTLTLLRKHFGWFRPFTSSFDQLKTILPLVVTSMPSEEIAVVGLLDTFIQTCSFQEEWNFPIDIEIPQNVINEAKKLWTESNFELTQPMPTDEDIQVGLMRLKSQNDKAKNDYQALLRVLIDTACSKNLQWRYELLGAFFLATCFLPHEKLSPDIVRYFLNLLIHDTLKFRQLAVRIVKIFLKLYKQKAIREKVDPFTICSADSSSRRDYCVDPGHRPDNMWCQYSEKNVPKTVAEWNEVRYSYHCYLGFYKWPKELYLSSSPDVQPVNNVDFEKLSDVGKEIDTFFLNQSNISKLINYFCLEEKKGSLLRGNHINLFKYLFKIHRDRYFEIFKPHFEELCTHKENSYQLCAAEMMSGMVLGTKLWPFSERKRFIEWHVPLMRKILDNITVETQRNWYSALVSILSNFDVNKCSYILDVLMEEPLKGDASSKDAGRLLILQCARLHSWRLSEFWTRLLEYIKPHLANSYQNLRIRLGLVLGHIFETDVEATNWNRTLSPRIDEFMNYLLPKLEILYNIMPSGNGATGDDCVIRKMNELNDDELGAIRLLKTTCTWCKYIARHSVYPLKRDFFKIFPLLCFMEHYDNDDELEKCCRRTLSFMSSSKVLVNDIPAFLNAFDKVCDGSSWCAKCSALEFLQVFTFYNLFFIISREEWILRIVKNLLRLLIDDRCEVRLKTGQVISGFFHHGVIKDASNLLEKFRAYKSVSLNENKNNLNTRHAGVIGLCSFINAYPYTVPSEVPPLFAEIGTHLKDPEPIPSTIRKTVSDFKRTHHLDWEQSKQQFTADQLEVFDDLVIPPNHYA